MNIGARIFKTGISVTLALLLAELIGIETPVFAAIGAFLAVQPSIYRSWKHLSEQIQANLIGGIIAILTLYFFGNNPFIAGVVVILLIAINSRFEINNIGISVLTAIAILEVQQSNFLFFALDRFGAVMLGVFSSIIINFIFLPPKYEERLLHHIETTNEKLNVLLRSLIEGEMEKKSYNEAKKTAENNIIQANNLYSLYKEEFSRTLKKSKFTKARKIIIFKQMIKLLEKELDIVYTFESEFQKIHTLSEETKNKLQNHLLLLTTFDEKIFLKYEGKIKPNHTNSIKEKIRKKNDELSKSLLDYYQEIYDKNGINITDHSSLLSFASSILNFSKELDKLNHLIDKQKKRQ